MKTFFKGFCWLVPCLAVSSIQAAPYRPGELKLLSTMNIAADLGEFRLAQTIWFPRTVNGDNWISQINEPGIARYPSGSSTPTMLVDTFNPTPPIGQPYGIEHRGILPFPGAFSQTYFLAAGSDSAFPNMPFNLRTNISRYDFNGSNRVDLIPPWKLPAVNIEFVDDNTVLFTSQTFPVNTALIGRVYLADVTAEPFTITSNTTWNANGYVQTSVKVGGIQVRKGEVYSGYAYYGGDIGGGTNQLFALNLATGVETTLANSAPFTGSGVRTVLERGGYLYLQTSTNSVLIYPMTDATTLGPLYTTWTKADFDALTEYEGPNYFGIDVTPGGHKWLLGARGVAFELVGLYIALSRSENNLILSWPDLFNGVVIQSTTTLTPPNFTDLDPQPAAVAGGGFYSATIPIGEGTVYYRLRN